MKAELTTVNNRMNNAKEQISDRKDRIMEVTESEQKTSDLPNCKKLPTCLGRAKKKRKNRDKRIGTRPAPLGGSCEEGKVSTH